MSYLRALRRVAFGLVTLPFFLGAIALQGAVVGPLTRGKSSLIPNFLYNTLRRFFGFRVVFNAASQPVAKDRPVWLVANHMSMADFIVMGAAVNGTFAGKGDVLKWPVASWAARAVRYIGLRRSTEFNAQSRGKIAANFNQGLNTIMFPEGTTSDGKKVYLFRAALISLLYGGESVDKKNCPVPLRDDVVVQPVAIRVTDVAGENAVGNDTLRNLYSMPAERNTLKRIWKRLQIKSITLELTAFAPLTPRDFADEKALINQAALNIASVINPGQTTFEKAKIPVAATRHAA